MSAARLWPAAALGILLLVLGGPGAASADDAERVLVMRAADLEAQGRCDEAVAIHREAASPSPALALVAGRCQVRLRDYPGAVETLTPASESPDADPEVDLYLGIAEYHMGSLDEARGSLERARARGEEGALLELYTGLLALQADDARAAGLALERARRSDERAVEPVASYYAWLAWRNVEDQERAEAALERVRAQDPDGPWIAEAERILAAEPAEPPTFWFNAEAGLEFDDNVTVRGNGVQQGFINGDFVSDKEDGRGIWTFDGGSEIFRNEDWSGGVLGAYTGTAHFDIDEFDTHYPTTGAWLDHHFDPKTTLRGRYDVGYAWVNYDPFLFSQIATATLFRDWGDAGRTELSQGAHFYDFKYDRLQPPAGTRAQIDQDGIGAVTDLLHFYQPGLQDLELRAGYRFTHYASDGSEFDYQAHRFLAGFDVTLPFEVGWDAWTAFTYQAHDRTSFYADDPLTDPKRRDRMWEFGTQFEKFLSENVSVLTRYRYTDSGSNTDVYDYDRHVVGAYVRIRFR